MKENKYLPLGEERSLLIGKTTFIVNSFADGNASKSAEQLIMQLLKSKISSNIIKEETL